jgi:hypothetical protein
MPTPKRVGQRTTGLATVFPWSPTLLTRPRFVTFLNAPQNRNLVSIRDAAHVTAWASSASCLQPWMVQPLLTR